MINSRTAIVCLSQHHGNTRKIAEAMADELQAEVLAPDSPAVSDLSRYDVVGWGSGIYFCRHHNSLLQLAESATVLPKNAFIFSTAGLPQWSALWHASLRNRLRKRDCEILGEFSCPGWDTVGPLRFIGGIRRSHPDGRDLASAADFARRIRYRMKRDDADQRFPTAFTSELTPSS
ncbi:MAG TPA: flavodoxin family protein [Pirellulales bacterium]|nr:flavodoxin family protein [Pirellulales bacterium]